MGYILSLIFHMIIYIIIIRFHVWQEEVSLGGATIQHAPK